jgi:hypothetical protein
MKAALLVCLDQCVKCLLGLLRVCVCRNYKGKEMVLKLSELNTDIRLIQRVTDFEGLKFTTPGQFLLGFRII